MYRVTAAPWGWIKNHKKTTTALCTVLGLLIVGLYFIFRSAPIEYVTARATRGDLVQTVEAVGTVISDRDLKLQFFSTGIVERVYVQEGDTVRAGQKIAQLRAGTQAADIAAAQGRVSGAEATLRALQQGARPEDIAISQADVDSKKASLEAARTTKSTADTSLRSSENRLLVLREEARISLSGTVASVPNTIAQQLTAVDSALSAIADIFSRNDVQDAIARSGTVITGQSIASLKNLRMGLQTFLNGLAPMDDFQRAIELLTSAKNFGASASGIADTLFTDLSQLPETNDLSAVTRDTYKASVSTQRASIQAATTALDAALRNLRDVSATLQTRIAAEEANLAAATGTLKKAEADIDTYTAALAIAQAQLSLKKAPARETDFAQAQATVAQMRAALASAVAVYRNMLLVAPVDGVVTKISIKQGEVPPAGPATTMLGRSPYRIEMFVSEVDIPRVRLTQSGSIELDAFRDAPFALKVSQIDTAATNKDGVNRYRVRLDFIAPGDAQMKIGMTGDATIMTGMRANVVSVPSRAIIEDDNSAKTVRVLMDGGIVREASIETGMEGGNGDVEVVQGVESGALIIVLQKK